MQTLGVSELRSLVQSSSPIVFEVLPREHFRSGHIPGAFCMPLENIASVASLRATNKHDAVVVYCASEGCKNSDIAAQKLESLGYEQVFIFKGGKAAWKDAGQPLEVSP